MRNILKLSIFLFMFVILSSISFAEDFYIYPTGDAYTTTWAPNTNYGNDVSIRARDRSRTGTYDESFVEFSLKELIDVGYDHTHILDANVTLYVNFVEGSWDITNSQVFTEWEEGTITFNNNPCGTGASLSANCNNTGEDVVTITGINANYSWTSSTMVKDALEKGYDNVSMLFWRDIIVNLGNDNQFHSANYSGDGSLAPTLFIRTTSLSASIDWDLELPADLTITNAEEIVFFYTVSNVQDHLLVDFIIDSTLNETQNITSDGTYNFTYLTYVNESRTRTYQLQSEDSNTSEKIIRIDRVDPFINPISPHWNNDTVVDDILNISIFSSNDKNLTIFNSSVDCGLQDLWNHAVTPETLNYTLEQSVNTSTWEIGTCYMDIYSEDWATNNNNFDIEFVNCGNWTCVGYSGCVDGNQTCNYVTGIPYASCTNVIYEGDYQEFPPQACTVTISEGVEASPLMNFAFTLFLILLGAFVILGLTYIMVISSVTYTLDQKIGAWILYVISVIIIITLLNLARSFFI